MKNEGANKRSTRCRCTIDVSTLVVTDFWPLKEVIRREQKDGNEHRERESYLFVVRQWVPLSESRHQWSRTDRPRCCSDRVEVILQLSSWFERQAKWSSLDWLWPTILVHQFTSSRMIASLTLCPSRWGKEISNPFNASCRVMVKLVYRSLFLRSNRECLWRTNKS